MSEQDWRLRAACLGAPLSEPFVTPDSNESRAFIAKYCDRCPVVSDCLRFALRVESVPGASRHGVFGGMTGPERNRLLRFGARLCAGCGRSFVPARPVCTRCQGCAQARTSPVPTTPVREHGTRAGYEQHLRRDEAPCWGCRNAKARYDQWWRSQKRAGAVA